VGYLDPNNARNNRIMLMNADGSGQTTFEASDTYEAYKFAWSPDSSKIAYFANKNGGSIYYTYIKPVSAGSSTQLSTGETVLVNDKSEYGPSFSRDSQYVAYAKKQSTTIPDDIWFAKADGSGTPTEERLTSTAVTKEYAPSFSPTESNILVCIASYNSGYYIHKLNINNTTEVTVLTSSKFGELLDGPLIWSSDGQWIYFTGGKSTDTNSRTYRIPASGGSGEVISQVDLVDAIDVAKFPGIERVYYIRTTWDVSSEGWYVPMPTGTPVKVIDNGKYNYFDYSNGHYW
jgi:Tol biopolymer transport system component